MNAGTVPQCGKSGAAAAALVTGSAGLVPSKTSRLDTNRASVDGRVISFSKELVAERRVKRLKRSVWASGHLHSLADTGHRAPQCWFVTLTYVGVSDWRSDHMSKAIEKFRGWCRSAGVACRYTWVAELQKRGAVHYHLLAWLPQGVQMPQWDKGRGRRVAFWPHGMTNTQKAIAGVGYLMKYLSKLGELTIFPKGLRLYGIGGLNASGKQVRAWHNLPEWCKRSYGVGELCRKAGRLVVRASGEILDAAFAVSLVPGGLLVRALRELPERFHAGPYSTFPRVMA